MQIENLQEAWAGRK